MARTDFPTFGPTTTTSVHHVRSLIEEHLASAMRDLDVATDPEDNSYYQGKVDTLTDIMTLITQP